MREELKDKTVLAMYDVRGIQNYIFSTNRIRDIIGASELVDNIVINGLKAVIKANEWLEEKYLTDWEKDDAEAFLKDDSIEMQVLFIGGGNAYVLFRKGKICQVVNRALAKYILDNTYSLNLAVAVVEKTDDYHADYEAINKRMREVKAVMPNAKPMGAFPFMVTDTATGFPLTKYDYSAQEYVSTESELKRRYMPKDDNAEKILDNMVTQKGDNSTLAVVHMDGNNMGKRIKAIMEKKTEYADAIRTMRKISKTIKYEYIDSFEKMCEAIDGISAKEKENAVGKLYRKVIVAGDDITFICNAKVAIYAVKKFLENVTTKLMYHDDTLSKEENRKKYAMSACAGIAFFYSHFPFSDAYEVAEACCSSAKKAAKSAVNRASGQKDGMIGCYLDYQMCSHIKAADLDAYRQRQYLMTDTGSLMIARPYYVSAPSFEGILDVNERNADKDVTNVLFENLKVFKEADATRSKYKNLRNAFSKGMGAVDTEIVFLESRDVKLPKTKPVTWYDALEIMDYCEWEEE